MRNDVFTLRSQDSLDTQNIKLRQTKTRVAS